jgi:hypothetical protein
MGMEKIKTLMKMAMLSLCLSVSAQTAANELDDLVDTSNILVGQIDQSIAFVGWSMEYTYQGQVAANALYEDGLISEDQYTSYNAALVAFSSFNPYGSSQDFLMNQADEEILNMNEAVDVFTEVVVDMMVVLEVNELAIEAETAGVGDPDAAQEVVDFVNEREDAGLTLAVTEEQVETFNQSVEDINESQGNAAAFIAVASNEDATSFLDTQAQEVNDSFDNPDVGVAFDRTTGAVTVAWNSSTAVSAVVVNGQDFGIDAFVSSADVLTQGYESDLYLTGPTNLGYSCFFSGVGCDYEEEQP